MRPMLTRFHHSAACMLLLSAATLACPSNESFESIGDTPATTTATTAASDPVTGSSGAPDTEPTSSSTGTASTTDVDTTTDTSTGTTGEPSNLCPDHATTDACCCFEAQMGFGGGVSNVCGTKILCATAEFECDQMDDTCMAVDEAAVDCVLEALRDGTKVGSLKVDYNINEGYGRRKLEFHLQGDGSAYVIDADELDAGGVSKPTGRHLLREAAYFEECLMGDVQAKADCLENVLGGKASEVCTEEFDYEL